MISGPTLPQACAAYMAKHPDADYPYDFYQSYGEDSLLAIILNAGDREIVFTNATEGEDGGTYHYADGV